MLIVAVIGTAGLVRHALTLGHTRLSDTQADVVIALSEFPLLVRTAVQELASRILGEPFPLLLDRNQIEKPSWVRRFPASEDSGFLLFSGVDPAAKHSIVQLIRISDGKVVSRWEPDWSAIYERTTAKKGAPVRSLGTSMAIHPLLLADGDIIFNTDTSLVRLSPCSPLPVWVLDQEMHHSIQFDESGSAVWVPSVSKDAFADNPWIRDRVRDDALAHVSTDGQVLDKRSFARILLDNGLRAMLLSGDLRNDPIHINEIKVALQSTHYWQRGDLLISAAAPSAVFLYRPSTDRIIWHQTGPWLHQHSADFVDDHRISVFDNNVLTGVPDDYAFVRPDATNHVILYDFDTGRTSEPYAALLAKARPVTRTQGRARVLPDGGLFVEETNYGRHLRFTRDRLLWSRINDYDDRRIGAVSWSRYLTAEEAAGPLRALIARRCQ